jgi:hypothetical protein
LKKTQEYAERFVAVIRRHCESRGLPADQPASPSATRPRDAEQRERRPPRTAFVAFERFDEGATIEQVMSELGRARSTVVQYLTYWIAERKPPSIERWISASLYDRIAEAGRRVGFQYLSPLREELIRTMGEEVSFEDMRLAVTHLQALGLAPQAPVTPADPAGT